MALRCCLPGSLRFPASAPCPLISAFDGVCQDAHRGRGEREGTRAGIVMDLLQNRRRHVKLRTLPCVDVEMGTMATDSGV